MREWITLGLGVFGFLTTWVLGAFKLGRAVEQMRAGVREEIEEEREKIIMKIEAIEARFDAEQSRQDHNFGEVGAAMRQYIADVEKKVREIEMYGRDHYVKISDFEKAIDRIGETFRLAIAELKDDIRHILQKPPAN